MFIPNEVPGFGSLFREGALSDRLWVERDQRNRSDE